MSRPPERPPGWPVGHDTRESEAGFDRLAAQLATYQRQEVERVAARRMHAPADLLLVTELADLIDADTGAVNVEAVEGAVASVIAERPHWANPAVDFGAGAGNGSGPSAPSIGETIKSM